MSKAIAAVEQPVFVRKHELAGLLKNVDKVSGQAVDLIVKTMEDEQNVPLKTRLACAEFLLQTQVKVADIVAKDQLVRQVAEIKAKGLVPTLDATGTPKKTAPSINFDELQEV